MKTMEKILTILPLTILFGWARCQWTTESGRDIAIRCYTELATEGDITSLFIDVSTPKQIASFCSEVSALKKCIRDNEHYLSLEENTEYQVKTGGVTVFYLNICPPGTNLTPKYQANAPCFQLIKDHILECGSYLPDLSTFKMKNDKKARCCALVSHHDCMLMVTEEKCGSETREVVNSMLEKYFQNDLRICSGLTVRNCSNIGDHFSHVDYGTTREREGNEDVFKKTTVGYPSKRRGSTEWDDWSRTTVADDWKSRTRFFHTSIKGSANYVSSNVLIEVLFCFASLLLKYNFCKLM
ncbi:uncharacterized protein LOC129217311 [Uloborus diversus]|uniref:uncharacterized protein LOC129217311 n=1 Tax=Uloborus diversus TaxID=327109 RepID=UPI0024095B00|nr:uncharacterized protein LOC129217311 [Uloborus diversus]